MSYLYDSLVAIGCYWLLLVACFRKVAVLNIIILNVASLIDSHSIMAFSLLTLVPGGHGGGGGGGHGRPYCVPTE